MDIGEILRLFAHGLAGRRGEVILRWPLDKIIYGNFFCYQITQLFAEADRGGRNCEAFADDVSDNHGVLTMRRFAGRVAGPF
ncbi:hypothetical protein KB236_08105 [Levilactobacillus brevis]|nr:hypothetical protein KB236_08105 [Levilactobacillus brevis]